MKLITIFFFLTFTLQSFSFAQDLLCNKIALGNAVANIDTEKVFSVQYPVGQQEVTHKLTNAHLTIPNSPFFVKTEPMIIFINGYAIFGDKIANLRGSIKEALQTKNEQNIFELVYEEYVTFKTYEQAVVNAIKIAEYFATTLNSLKNGGVKGFHLIGVSLGAHLAGHTGKQFNKLNPLPLDRITGLDPAGPCFKEEPKEKRLDKSDAQFVDIIHSSTTQGMLKAIGSVDCYPNGGERMPGVNNDHLMAFKYFIESINSNNLLSVVCADWNTFKTGACKTNPAVPMGYCIPTTTTGNRYLRTAAYSLYGLGTAGLSM